MAYDFNFDLSKLSQPLFREIAKFSQRRDIHRRMGKTARTIVERFKIHKIVGIPVSDALMVVEDLIDTYVGNVAERESFLKTNHRALLLPHCSRKFMDSRCKSDFDPETSSFRCNHCSEDCAINQATRIGEKRGYDVFVLPGGSCIRKIMKNGGYDGVVGVACCEEIKLAKEHFLRRNEIPYQAVPLIKNGCSGTKFNLKTLEDVM